MAHFSYATNPKNNQWTISGGVDFCDIIVFFIFVWMYRKFFRKKFTPVPPNYSGKVILITGCDTGLGYSFAKYADHIGFKVIATFLNLDSEGSKQLQTECNRLIPLRLDIRKLEDRRQCFEFIEKYLEENPNLVFHSLVNNAGTMVFGEFEWFTPSLIDEQIDINFTGTVKFTYAFLPLLRKYKGRIITITSHCVLSTLPALALYGATKSALDAWSDGLRLELKRHDLKVIKFIPGSYIFQTNILSRLTKDSEEMIRNLSTEKNSFYLAYMKKFYNYLKMIPTPDSTTPICDKKLYTLFEHALVSPAPKVTYKNEGIRYKIYHLLFKLAPTIGIKDFLIRMFVAYPNWVSEEAKEVS